VDEEIKIIKQPGLNINNSIHSVHLSSAERKILLNKLTDAQRDTLEEHRRFRVNSMLLTQFNETGTEWMFIEKQIDPTFDIHFPNESRLHCSCGRGVKYLYVCKSKENNIIQSFGINHLEQEAGISKSIIKEIKSKEHQIDRGLDEILNSVKLGNSFPNVEYEFLKERGYIETIFSDLKLEYLSAFKKVDLPIYEDDMAKLVEKCKEIQRALEVKNSEWSLHTIAGEEFIRQENDYFLENRETVQDALLNQQERVMNNARKIFKKIFLQHTNVIEKYDLDTQDGLLILIISVLFSEENGQQVTRKKTVFDTLYRLSNKYGYDISSFDKIYEMIFAILKDEGMIKHDNNMWKSNYK
jgi:hypothetical protein